MLFINYIMSGLKCSDTTFEVGEAFKFAMLAVVVVIVDYSPRVTLEYSATVGMCGYTKILPHCILICCAWSECCYTRIL